MVSLQPHVEMSEAEKWSTAEKWLKKLYSRTLPPLLEEQKDDKGHSIGYIVNFVNESDWSVEENDYSDLDSKKLLCGPLLCEGVDFCKTELGKKIPQVFSLQLEKSDPRSLIVGRSVGLFIQTILRECSEKQFSLKLSKRKDFLIILCKKCLRKGFYRCSELTTELWKEVKLHTYTAYDVSHFK